MKKRMSKRLILNRVTVSRLSQEDMNAVVGATLYLPCTESCSLYIQCCPVTTTKKLDLQELDRLGI